MFEGDAFVILGSYFSSIILLIGLVYSTKRRNKKLRDELSLLENK